MIRQQGKRDKPTEEFAGSEQSKVKKKKTENESLNSNGSTTSSTPGPSAGLTSISVTTETSSSTTALPSTPATDISSSTTTRVASSSATKKTPCSATKIASRSATKVVSSSGTKIASSSDTKIASSSDTKIASTSATKVATSPPTKIIYISATKITSSSDTKIASNSATDLTSSSTDLTSSLECSSKLSSPGKPNEVSCTSNTIDLAWDPPTHGLKLVVHYEIKYKECNQNNAKWIPVVTETSRCIQTIPDLKCGTDYEFKVRAINADGEEGPFSPAVKMSTKLSLAKSVQLSSKSKKVKSGKPAVFKLPITQVKGATNWNIKTRKCVFGKRKTGSKEKTIMLVGATGSGKSTLIDGMINYITDVSWEDDFRFSLVDLTKEEKNRHSNQTLSQTEWITCYTIHRIDGSKIDYDLNIIDTPGFGDTRGIIRDKAIVDQIREFFTRPGDQGIAFLDAVCFVSQAPLARLTPPQRYIFDAILSVFGQDVASNIYVLITFADGNEPPVREALKAANVPFQNSFKFNNSALFASSEKTNEAKFGNLFWKMGQESFRIFFKELGFVESKSLQLTTEVLQLRQRLEVTIEGLQPQIAEGLNQLNTIRQEREILQRHKTDIEANRNFHYEVEEIHMKKLDLQPGQYVTNCLTCNRTCHFPCGIPKDSDKAGCWAMTNGECRICPKKCHWSMHRNNEFRFETYPVKVKKTYDELKRKYEIATEEERKQRSVIGKVRDAFSSLGCKVMKMVYDVREYINKLNEIALRPNPLSDLDYIDLLIESEKNEKKYGWENRLRLFYKMRKEAELVAKTTKPNFRPWGEDEDIVNDDY